jgi:hypothetical protein
MTLEASYVLNGYTLHSLLSTAQVLISLAVLYVAATSVLKRSRTNLTAMLKFSVALAGKYVILALLWPVAKLIAVFSTTHTRIEL